MDARKFVMRNEKHAESWSGGKKPPDTPSEENQSRPRRVHHDDAPRVQRSTSGGDDNMAYGTTEAKRETHRNGSRARESKTNHFYDTDAESIGDTTVASKANGSTEGNDQAAGHDAPRANAGQVRAQSGIDGLMKTGEALGVQQARNMLNSKVASLGIRASGDAGSTGRFSRAQMQMDYPSTSPSELDFKSAGVYGLDPRPQGADKPEAHTPPRSSTQPRASSGPTKAEKPPVPLFPLANPVHSEKTDARHPGAAAPTHSDATQHQKSHNNGAPQRGRQLDSGEDSSSSTKAIAMTQKRSGGADYDIEQLKEKSYADLKNEPFERGTRDRDVPFPKKPAPTSLRDKLEYLRKLPPEDPDYPRPTDDQIRFFSLLPIQEHEECGDLIAGQFQDIIARLRDLRRDKRAAALAFEAEIEKRVTSVQQQKDKLDDELKTLKLKGEDVIKARG